MVFADLSGFTAMSERLSRLGRVGAEEVTDAISGCFTELLAVAYDAGGGLLKFGGDALLLAFRGDDHANGVEEDDEDEDEDEEVAEVPLAVHIPKAHAALVRAIRRKLTEPAGGDLPHDLTAAVVETVHELLGDRDECTVAELNELFGLSWREPHWSLALDDLPTAISELEPNLYYDWDMLEFLDCTVATDSSVLASSPEGSAAMMSDGGIGLYEFTVDDGVYFFVLAARDVCESQWWFAHGVHDMESRAEAIRSAEVTFALSEDPDD